MKKLQLFFFLLLLGSGNAIAQTLKNEVTVDFRYDIVPGNKTSKVKLVCVLPQTIIGRQEVVATEFSMPPSRVFTENGNLYATFELERPSTRQEITITTTLNLYRYDLKTAEKEAGAEKQFFSVDSLAHFLREEQYIEKGNAGIVAMAATLKAADTNETLKNIYAFVNQKLNYKGYLPADMGAAKALENLGGDCSEFSDLFVALCRASQIPARVVDGYVTNWTNSPKHSWAEVYTPALGWVPFDPTPGNRSYYSSMRNRYIYLSSVRNDKALNNYHFYTHSSWGEAAKVNGTLDIRNTDESSELARSSVF